MIVPTFYRKPVIKPESAAIPFPSCVSHEITTHLTQRRDPPVVDRPSLSGGYPFPDRHPPCKIGADVCGAASLPPKGVLSARQPEKVCVRAVDCENASGPAEITCAHQARQAPKQALLWIRKTASRRLPEGRFPSNLRLEVEPAATYGQAANVSQLSVSWVGSGPHVSGAAIGAAPEKSAPST